MRAPAYSADEGEIFSAETIANPQPLYARLLSERPLARIADSGFHTVASPALITDVLDREVDFSANLSGVLYRDDSGRPAAFELPGGDATQVIATADDPAHAIHRSILQPQFLSGRIKALEPLVRQWAEELLSPYLAAGGGDFTLVAERLPARVIGHLLGLPQADSEQLRSWAMMGGDMLAGEISAEGLGHLATETAAMAEYLGRHLDVALASEAGGEDITLLQTLAQAVREKLISREQAVGIAIVLFGAGGESTAALIASVAHQLALQPKMAEQLRREAKRVPLFVEEVIRLQPPFNFHYRVVRRDCELAGYTLRAGERLLLLWAAANRDPAVYPEPHTIRLDRKHSRQHLGFGRGLHFCLGAALARLEAKVVLEALLAEGRSLIVAGDAEYAKSIFVRRHRQLPLALQ